MKIKKKILKELLATRINYYLLINHRSKQGFALTQILILSVGLSIALVGLVAASINRLSTAKLSQLELSAKNATDSGITIIRTLFNNSRNGVYYYFWLAKTCAANSDPQKECPTFNNANKSLVYPGSLRKGDFPDLTSLYWTDGTWCDGISYPTCAGRQVAPVCTYLGKRDTTPINWWGHRNAIRTLLNTEQPISSTSTLYGKRNSIQTFSLKSTDYVGTENGGENSLLVEGYTSSPSNTSVKNATNKLRANIEVIKTVNPSAFGFISAGGNQRDDESLFLGNLTVDGDKLGSIIWRRNLANSSDCRRLRTEMGLRSLAGLPDNNIGRGGVWVQPLPLPAIPTISKASLPGFTSHLRQPVCTPVTTVLAWSNCRYLETTGWDNFKTKDRTISIDDLIVKGQNAYFGIVTSDNSRLTLIIKGSVDVSNGGKICHKHEKRTAQCGSGKPENLTILFDQPGLNPQSVNQNGKQEIACSVDGGMTLTRNQNIPYNTLLISHTGNNNRESFSGFVYASDTTFSTSIAKSQYYQKPKSGGKLLVTFRGVYGYVKDPESQFYKDRTPNLIRTPRGKLIPFGTDWKRVAGEPYLDNLYLIAIGTRSVNSNPGKNSMLDMGLVWDQSRRAYSLRGLVIDTSTNEARFVDRNQAGREFYIPLGSTPFLRDRFNNRWIDYYNIDVTAISTLPKEKYFKGAMWMKNVCLDEPGNWKVIWDFDEDFSTNLVKRYNKSIYNYGVPYYRGKSIKVWDTLRDFYQ